MHFIARPRIDLKARPQLEMNFYFDVYMKMDAETRNAWFKAVARIVAGKIARKFPSGIPTGEDAYGLVNWTLYKASLGLPPYCVDGDATITAFWWRMLNRTWSAHREQWLTQGRGEGKEVCGVADDARSDDSMAHLVQSRSGFRTGEDAAIFANQIDHAEKIIRDSIRPGTAAGRIREHGLSLISREYDNSEIATITNTSESSVRQEVVRIRNMIRPAFYDDGDDDQRIRRERKKR